MDIDLKQNKKAVLSAACLRVVVFFEGLLNDLFPALDEVKVFLNWLTAVGS